MPYTAADGVQVPAGTDAFSPPVQFKTWVDKGATYNNRLIVASLTDRDNLTGMATGWKCYVTADGSEWLWTGTAWVKLPSAGVPVYGSGGSSMGVAEATVAGCSIVLPAGKWDLVASGYADWSTSGGTPPVSVFRIRSGGLTGTELDQKKVNIVSHAGQVPFMLQSSLDLASTTTVVLTASSTGPSAGTTLVQNARIRALPTA